MTTVDIYKEGQSIDQYTVVKTLTASKNSHLYIVQGKSVHKKQVLKLHVGSLSQKSCATFILQANLLLEFSSQPNIVDVLHVGTIVEKPAVESAPINGKVRQVNERPFMVMPFYPQTLNDLLAVHHQKLSFVTSVNIINQVIDGLYAIHHLGIAHLDIKPQNIFLDEHNNALIADFDSAMVLNSSPLAARFQLRDCHSSGQQRATLDYASPEQTLALHTNENNHLNNNTIGTPSDMYSLGVLWCRMLMGKFLQKPLQKQGAAFALDTQLEDVAPAWAIKLISDLLHNHSEQRPNASQCRSRILAQLQAPEANHTVQADALEIPQEINLIQQEIKQILLQQGWLSEQDKERLLLSYRSRLQANVNDAQNDSNLKNQKDSLQRIIEQCQAHLIADKNLSSWFGWINYLQILLVKSGKQLTISQYQHVLQMGRASRPDDHNVAERLLKKHFQLSRVSSHTIKRYVLPLLIILLVFIYWGYESQTKKQFSVDSPLNKKSQAIANDAFGETTQTTIPAQNNIILPVTSNIINKPLAVESQEKLLITAGTYKLFIEQYSTTQKIEIEWVSLKELPDIRIMTTEVTNELFALCAKDGACRPITPFSMASKTATIDLPGHPMVSIDWYEVTQQFIPWLNKKTQKRFTLPSYDQWLIISGVKQSDSSNNVAIHCKNCNHSLARQYAGVTMPVKAIKANKNGIYNIFGNVQEWLNDCWQQRSADNTVVERCDQAMVAGGSWVSKKSELETQAVSQLLKSARTPTTGFRLIEWVNE
jgi:serine/threonine protein kinase